MFRNTVGRCFPIHTTPQFSKPPVIHLLKNMSTIRLQCLIHGEMTKRIFSVDIDNSNSIADLKKMIKTTQPVFDNFDINKLDIWKVHMPLHTLDDLILKILEKNSYADIETELSLRIPRTALTNVGKSHLQNTTFTSLLGLHVSCAIGQIA